jgi:hypothetical protein
MFSEKKKVFSKLKRRQRRKNALAHNARLLLVPYYIVILIKDSFLASMMFEVLVFIKNFLFKNVYYSKFLLLNSSIDHTQSNILCILI